ncbi:hypothetical protein Aduo_004236 [Ancylostoma duodenale]
METKEEVLEFSLCGLLFKLIFCFLMPPLAVFFAKGGVLPIVIAGVLTKFYWIPGVLYALWFCFLRKA